MKNVLKMLWFLVFLAVIFPYTAIMLMNGQKETGREETLPDREYQVLESLLKEDISWMDQETRCLMAVLIRTEQVRTGSIYQENTRPAIQAGYEAAYQAVRDTCGKVIMIDGSYRELPYHKVSAGKTRPGILLGDDSSYIKAAECPEDLQSEQYLHRIRVSREKFLDALDKEIAAEKNWEKPVLERDSSGYVIYMDIGEERMKGEKVRDRLHLPSSCFFIDDSDMVLQITVKGDGHGFGISLFSADRMIRDGMTYEDVIPVFFENAECITLP